MISIRLGNCQIEVEGSVRRVTITYGESPKPRYLTVVGDDNEGWSLDVEGNELGVRPTGVTLSEEGPLPDRSQRTVPLTSSSPLPGP